MEIVELHPEYINKMIDAINAWQEKQANKKITKKFKSKQAPNYGRLNTGTLTQFSWHAKYTDRWRYFALCSAVKAHGPEHIKKAIIFFETHNKQYSDNCRKDICLIDTAQATIRYPRVKDID